MVILSILDPNRVSILEDRAVRRYAVGDPCQELRKVERCVRVVTNPQQKHLPVQTVDPTNRTFRDVRGKRKRIRGDPGCLGSCRRKGVEMIASRYPGQSPEGIRDHPKAGRCWSDPGIEWPVILIRPGWHDQSSIGAEDIAESLDQTPRAALHRPDCPKRCVYQQDTALFNPECAELSTDIGSAQLDPCGLAFRHGGHRGE
jgi:hypothetical protein